MTPTPPQVTSPELTRPELTRAEVTRVVTEMIAQILPEIPQADIKPQQSLASLGATSIDRVEIALGAMETLGLVMRPAEFAGLNTIAALIDLLCARSAPP